MTIAETLTTAIGAFKLELDFRDNIRPRRMATPDKVIITETGFSSQLPGGSGRAQELQSAPLRPSKCSLANVTILSNAIAGADFGMGTPRPLKIRAPPSSRRSINSRTTQNLRRWACIPER